VLSPADVQARGDHTDIEDASMRRQSIRMTVQWKLPTERARSVSDALHAITVAAPPRDSLLRCWFPPSLSDTVVLRYTTLWTSEETLRQHIASGRFAPLAELVERAGPMASIAFEQAGTIHGIEYIEALQHQPQRAQGSLRNVSARRHGDSPHPEDRRS